MLDLIRSADLVLLIVDLQANPIQQLEDTVAILHEHEIAPRRRKNHHAEQQHPTLLPILVVVNKTDNENLNEDYRVLCELFEQEWALLAVSAQTGCNLEQFRRVVYENLEIMRIYSKPPGKEPDLSTPFVLKKR